MLKTKIKKHRVRIVKCHPLYIESANTLSDGHYYVLDFVINVVM